MPGLKSIAVVEDDKPTALLWQRVVRRAGFACAGRFADAESAWKVFRHTAPSLVLLDFELLGHNGGWLAARLRGLPVPVLVLMITCHDEPAVLREAIGVPVNGFIRKPVSPKELELRIREVFAGDMPLTTRHGAALWPATAPLAGSPASILSPREREIVTLSARGDSAKEMACQLHIAITTIPTYKVRTTQKMNARHFKEAVAFAAGFRNWYRSPLPSQAGTSGAPSVGV
ncbi:MAG: response regulator transcription factor [Limisphaerales bacterium]